MEQSRLNLKIPTEIKNYLSEIAWRNRQSVTQYLLNLIKKDMANNFEIVKKIKGEE